MKILWCWRCQTEYPMLEDHEWAILMDAHRVYGSDGREAAFTRLQEHASRLGLRPPLEPIDNHAAMTRRLWHLVAGFELFTEILESSPNPIWHHYVSHYGPPCASCGKPLRTSKANFCAACGGGRTIYRPIDAPFAETRSMLPDEGKMIPRAA